MSDQKVTGIGVIGCGNISDIYFTNLNMFRNTRVVAAADLIHERAENKAAKHNLPRALSVEKLLADPEVEMVVNLTTPESHAAVAIAALEAGKHVYGEKPFTVTREQGRKVRDLAKAKGLRVGGAPDTFLGGSHQTVRKLIDDGAIGAPVGANAFMLCRGHESWHPSPEFYYSAQGGGPLMDMGPYYLSDLAQLLGGITRCTGSARVSFPERLITSEPLRGTRIKVETPTHIAGVFEFASGAIGSLVTSFDVTATALPNIEIYGTEGTIKVPDPNGFGGKVFLKRAGDEEWKEIELTHGFAENSRGIGVADMAAAIETGRAHRASGDFAYHILDTMRGVLDSAESGKHYTPEYVPERPAALPTGLPADSVEM